MFFIDVKPFELGPLEIHLFGVLVAAGVVIGSGLASRYAEKNAIDADYLRWVGFRLVVGGFIICHFIDVIFYQQHKLAKDPLLLIKIWEGISSYGGFIGGFIMFMWYTQSRYERPVSRLELADNAIYAFAPGFWFGRMGCSVAHDHPGIPTDFGLAPTWPAGRWPGNRATQDHPAEFPEIPIDQAVQAHDLGLYEALFLMPAIVLGVVLISRWKGRKPGMMLAYACILYSIPRFFLEYLRLEGPDPRYAGFTPGQWFSVMLLGAGLYLVFVAIPKHKKSTWELAQERIESGAFKPYDPDDEEQEPPPRARAKKKKGSGSGSAKNKSSGSGSSSKKKSSSSSKKSNKKKKKK